MKPKTQLEFVEWIESEFGDSIISYPTTRTTRTVKILIPDKHIHDGFRGSPREFSFEAASFIEAAKRMLEHAGGARDGAFCGPDCINYRPQHGEDTE